MSVKDNVDYTKDEIIKEIYNGAMDAFCQGIAVPSNNNHPCNWDWLDFKQIDNEDVEYDILHYKFELDDISNGIYSNHEYEGLTLKQVINKTKGKFLFEIYCCVDWD